ncbi:sigma-70 family RNA polymerase sigma factor [Brevibacillus ruminantium]|uniref:Sigma-70 family RNA polymerase sigma factor n=1 Tax=Brevibacillus ruminantium TaxID=2950604 RepID=A0ABY4WHP4_9BACL|nr:sigma-70 family RNA polymerase sigma factor [Brevibacillus ruminantium]USG66642.1 sigma-70 family RNA polymerase sigma factor [Brevibacillus ruminantium]
MEKKTMSLANSVMFFQHETQTDAKFFHEVFDCYHQRIYQYMRYRISNSSEAEELTSQVFEKVMQKIHTFRPERAPFEVWLFSIAHHTVNDFYRRQRRWQWSPLESIKEMVSSYIAPEEAVSKKAEESELIEAIYSLKERERRILSLKFVGELKNNEIAEIVGLSESNVGVILYRSLRQLRKILKERGGNHE